jgi:hypothetical protein
MSLRHLTLLLPVATLSVACFDDKDDDDDEDDDEDDSGYDWSTTTGYYGTTGTGTTGGSTPAVSVSWGSTGVDIAIAGGAGGWWFGMAETRGCSDCWTGEDCVYGYTYSGGSLNYCHDAGDTGTGLTYGGDATALSAGTTLFPDSSFESTVTYYLESQADFSCWVWGDDPSYYDGLGCDQL